MIPGHRVAEDAGLPHGSRGVIALPERVARAIGESGSPATGREAQPRSRGPWWRRWDLAAAFVLCIAAGPAQAWSNRPQNKYTGAPGEQTCAFCHGNLNVAGGSIGVVAPPSYVPDDTLDGVVTLQRSGQRRWGFELTILDAAERAAGHILVSDPNRTLLSIQGDTGREYLKQTSGGTDSGKVDSAPGWICRWIAPPAGTGDVTIYVAGCAADGDFTSGGDFVYTTALTLHEAPTAIALSSWGAIKSLYVW